MTDGWPERARALADRLAGRGALRSDAWRAAVSEVPRHELVPRYYEPHGAGHRLVVPHDEASRRAWLDLVYSDTTLLTAVLPGPSGREVPVSSSTKPGLTGRMLEALDVRDGATVLEVGTGTGYHAALLCHRLGADRVFSVDLRPELVDAARERLAAIGYRPVLRTADGRAGLPEHAPYDRIVATCSVSTVPTAWIDQTAPGGLVLVDVEGQFSAGNLALLRRGDDDVLEGRFLEWFGRFMPLRHGVDDVGGPWPEVDRSRGAERTTTVDPRELDEAFRLLAQYRLPAGTRHTLAVEGDTPVATCLTRRDGSWCAVDRAPDRAGRHRVRHSQGRDLWADVERAHEVWTALGTPAWHRFGLTVTPTSQRLWLDDPEDTVADLPT